MRIMNGDNPSIEYEDGTQKGGNRGCPGCDGDVRRAGEYDYMAYRKYRTLEEKQKLVLEGEFGKQDSPNPFKSLKVDDLRKELKARHKDTFSLKAELQERLTDVLGGTSRVPAILFGLDNNITLNSLNLTNYEVLLFEPLHFGLNHIAHILDELPHHITDLESLVVLKETVSIALKKVKIRCTDYRRALLQVTLQLLKQPGLEKNVMELLLTLCEMMAIFYSKQDKRNPKQVLRLHNLVFRHSLALESVLLPPKTMNTRKLQGIYYHQAVDHAPLLYRMICFTSISAELFDRVQDITHKTWSKQPQDLVPNVLLHIAAEDEFQKERDTMASQEKEISKLAKHLPVPTNTVIERSLMLKKSRLWQAHLSKIPDYLRPGNWWQWTDQGDVMFKDGPHEEERKATGPPLLHFRSIKIKYLQKDLETKWEERRGNAAILPLMKLRDEEGKLLNGLKLVIMTTTLP